MKKRSMGLAALCAALSLCATGLVAGELGGGFQPIAMKSNTKTPIGARQFCTDWPQECVPVAAATTSVRYSAKARRDLDQVNARFNAEITAMTDEDYYKKTEYWTYPTAGVGDCEDFVLVKRRELMNRGWPASVLRVALVRQRNGAAHAVLVANTDGGDFVLDNLAPTVVDWSETPYKYIKISSPETIARWIDVKDDRVVWVASK